MSYQVLARKWRPKNFEELMGQEHVVTVLVNALAQQRLHHAYLFTGTRGVGKTTIARIFAKSLNCETGITTTPCGQCDTCLEIDQGRFVDLLEIDAASKTKVDDTREILDNVQYAPTRGRYKVYLIDEVHMLSRSSFNALLKTLEEPPEHVKFILATTDPQKLPVTVLSRCLQFHLKALTVNQIETKLSEILSHEQVTHAAGTLTLLAKAARGSMRDSLSLTDQAIAQGQGNITLANIQQMLGGVDQNWVYKIVIALLKQDGTSLMSLTQEIASFAPSYSRLFAELIQLFHQIAMLQIVEQHFDLPPEHAKLLKKFSQAMSPEDVQLYYQICVNGRKDLPYASDEQAAFDMTILRLFAFKPMQQSQLQPVQQASSSADVGDDDLSAAHLPEPALPNPQVAHTQLAKNELASNTAPDSKVAENIADADADADAQMAAVPHVNDNHLDILEDTLELAPDEQVLAEQMQAIELEAAALQAATPSQNEPQHQQTMPSQQVEQFSGAGNEVSNSEPAVSESTPEPTSEPVVPAPTIAESKESEPPSAFDSPVSAVLATRNMLRSRKKQLDKQGKKSSDAIARQVNSNAVSSNVKSSVATEQAEINKSAVESDDSDQPSSQLVNTENEIVALPKPEQSYQAENIDPATIRKANQVDKWAHMIDSMELTARLRQLAIHATIDENSTDDNLILCLNQTTKHLYTDVAQQQLQQSISQFLSRAVQVTITIVEQTIADPYQIQSHINDKRYDYAKALLKSDDIVQALEQRFQATLDDESIAAL